jgi:autoinducer 2-degrading protein
MLALTVHLTIQPENVESFLPLVLQNAAASRSEPGCRQFDVLVDPQDRTRIMLFEIYDNEAAFDAHQQSRHFQAYLTEAVPLLASRERFFWQRLSPA